MLLFSRYILKVDASQFIMPERFKEELQNKKSTKSQRIALVLLLIYAVCLVLPGLFPSLPGMTLLSNLGIVGISLIALLVMALLKIEGSPLINLTKVFDQHMNWTLLLLLHELDTFITVSSYFPIGRRIKRRAMRHHANG